MADYDPRYLAGVLLFNRRDYFDAHEVWESLWRERGPDDRRFVQGLIQAAVALYHLGRGNLTGAGRLFESGRSYMAGCPAPAYGLSAAAFWDDMGRYFRHETPDPPRITLDPAPAAWPDPADFVREAGDDPDHER